MSVMKFLSIRIKAHNALKKVLIFIADVKESVQVFRIFGLYMKGKHWNVKQVLLLMLPLHLG